MVARNIRLGRLSGGYLFPEIARRRDSYLDMNPDAKLISLGIGNTTLPLPPYITEGLVDAAKALGTNDGYSGYGGGHGLKELRGAIAKVIYNEKISSDEVFISDGAKCSAGRLAILFGSDTSIAIQDPAYPVYVDDAVIVGQTKNFDRASGQYTGICYLPCTPENNFFPDLSVALDADIIYFCSPHNPTGVTATRKQLEELVKFAKKYNKIIVFDSAYASYIKDSSLPKSIYEIEGADKVAIEIGSFSKMAGFTGVRLGWIIVPEALTFRDGEKVIDDWKRIHTTLFNGASNIAQRGGVAILSKEGQQEAQQMINYYMDNAKVLREAVTARGLVSYGGDNSPYLWVEFPGKDSWEVFDWMLREAHIVCTPGVGFGPSGQGFIRLSAFGSKEDILEAAKRLKALQYA